MSDITVTTLMIALAAVNVAISLYCHNLLAAFAWLVVILSQLTIRVHIARAKHRL